MLESYRLPLTCVCVRAYVMGAGECRRSPNDNRMLAHQLTRFHGNLTAENTISDVISYVGTGDLHVAVYDHAAMLMYMATARPDGGTGPLPAYQRTFTKLDMTAIFATAPPQL